MVDPIAAIITAMSTPTVTALVSNRVWVGPDLPQGYTPDTGPAILCVIRGGGFDYTRTILSPSLYVQLYGTDEGVCIDLWRTCCDAWMDRGNGVTRLRPDSSAMPRLLRTQTTLWLFALSGWTAHIKNY